jgi:hypothetical protein
VRGPVFEKQVHNRCFQRLHGLERLDYGRRAENIAQGCKHIPLSPVVGLF